MIWKGRGDEYLCRIFSSMSSSSHKSDASVLSLYRQGGCLSKIGYFKAIHFKISFDDSFRDFLEAYKHAILSGVRPYSGAQRAIKFHPYYFMLGFTFPMPNFFQEVLCFIQCAFIQCSPNKVCVMVGFLNLNQFFDLDLTVNEFWYFFDTGRIDGVGQLQSCHRFFNHSSKGNHDWAKETLETSGKWESKSFPELYSEFGSTPKTSPDMKKVHIALGGNKRFSQPAQKIPIEKKPKTSSTACEGLPTAKRLMIDLTSSKRKKNKAARSEPMTSTMPKIASTMADSTAQHRDTKVAKEMATTMVAEVYSSTEKIKKLESKLVTLKVSNISAFTSLHLQTARPEIIDLKTRLNINKNPKNEVDELQHVRVSLLEENKQLKGGKAGLEASLIQIGHLFGRSSDFEFAGKDFKTFSIAPEYLLAFTFEASIGEVVGEVGAQAGAARGEALDDVTAKNVAAAESVVTK
ncbi:hypothetical protein D8674_024575 [Pyrus ussuriensis x Pyrus communis]|uniref:Uncharacterized protein n=1 Tax=Pyrus ussuriensis x Pyrus communis TaxID=2448454 RepID=A0A5N5H752_9ROSA|nr:hypothetical protein D8674_024575 [Pyrus ussuriensis x Pyrus communis]